MAAEPTPILAAPRSVSLGSNGWAPLLVAVEGVDNSGKTTLTGALATALRERGMRVALSKEPSGSKIGRLFRDLSRNGNADALTMALLSTADRQERQRRLADRAAAGGVILSDRYYLSGLAYHAAEGVEMAFYQHLNQHVRRPSLYLYLDLNPTVAAARAGTSPVERWEQPGIAARVPVAYQTAIALVERTEAAQVVRVDATQTRSRMLEVAVETVVRLVQGQAEGIPP